MGVDVPDGECAAEDALKAEKERAGDIEMLVAPLRLDVGLAVCSTVDAEPARGFVGGE